MSLQLRVWFPESEDVVGREQPSLVPGGIENWTGMTLWEGEQGAGERCVCVCVCVIVP